VTPPRDEGKVEIALRDGVLWVRFDGVVLFQTALGAMKAAAQGARSHGTDRLIFDLRAGTYPEFHTTTLESARRASEVGLNTALRIAILGLPEDPKLRFIEDVGANRGFQLRAFSDEQQAVAWVSAGRP
jgi:hypothetical protein